jgi:hypothetical protein
MFIPSGMHVPYMNVRSGMGSTLTVNVDVRNVMFGNLSVTTARSSVRLNVSRGRF